MIQVGERVEDKFKQPRPGDHSNQGTITGVHPTTGAVTVEMDSGVDPIKVVPRKQFDLCYRTL